MKSGHIFHFNFSTFSAAEFLIRCRVKDKVATASAFPFNAIPNEGRRGEGRGELFMHSNSFLPPSDGNSISSGTPLDVYPLLFFPSFFFFLFYSHFIDLDPDGLLLLIFLLLEVIHWAMTMPPPPLQNDDEFLLLPLPFHILMRLLQLQIVAELRECPQQFRDRPLGAG